MLRRSLWCSLVASLGFALAHAAQRGLTSTSAARLTEPAARAHGTASAGTSDFRRTLFSSRRTHHSA